MADSRSLDGGMVLSIIACLLGLSTQLSFASIKPLGPCSASVGSASLSASGSDVPIPRTITFFGWVPVIIKPPIRTLSPVSTRRRVEILARVVTGAGEAVAVAVGVGIAVPVGVAVGVGVGADWTVCNSNA